jgi:hypothetical protein
VAEPKTGRDLRPGAAKAAAVAAAIAALEAKAAAADAFAEEEDAKAGAACARANAAAVRAEVATAIAAATAGLASALSDALATAVGNAAEDVAPSCAPTARKLLASRGGFGRLRAELHGSGAASAAKQAAAVAGEPEAAQLLAAGVAVLPLPPGMAGESASAAMVAGNTSP